MIVLVCESVCLRVCPGDWCVRVCKSCSSRVMAACLGHCRYVFKRLKFLGNKDVSQGTTLLFLALWHGLHSGYFMCFLLEFLIVTFERSVSAADRQRQ